MRMTKKIVSALLAVCMLASMFVVGAAVSSAESKKVSLINFTADNVELEAQYAPWEKSNATFHEDGSMTVQYSKTSPVQQVHVHFNLADMDRELLEKGGNTVYIDFTLNKAYKDAALTQTDGGHVRNDLNGTLTDANGPWSAIGKTTTMTVDMSAVTDFTENVSLTFQNYYNQGLYDINMTYYVYVLVDEESTTEQTPTEKPVEPEVSYETIGVYRNTSWDGGAPQDGGTKVVNDDNTVTVTFTENAQEYQLYDWNHVNPDALTDDAVGIRFKLKIDSVGAADIPLEAYFVATDYGTYQTQAVPLTAAVGETGEYVMLFENFAVSGEVVGVTPAWLKTASHTQFRVRAQGHTDANQTNLGGITYTLSDIETIREAGSAPATTESTTEPEPTTTEDLSTYTSTSLLNWLLDARNYSNGWGQGMDYAGEGGAWNGNGIAYDRGILTSDEDHNLVVDTFGNNIGKVEQQFWVDQSANAQNCYKAAYAALDGDTAIAGKKVQFTVTNTGTAPFLVMGKLHIPGAATTNFGHDQKTNPAAIVIEVGESKVITLNLAASSTNEEGTFKQPEGSIGVSAELHFIAYEWGNSPISGTMSPISLLYVAPETTTEPAPETTTEPAPETTTEPAPETTTEPAPETTTEPAPETTTKPITADDVVIQADTVYAKAGERIEVPVRLTQAPKMWAMGWFAEFDNTKLTLVDVTGGDVFNEEFSEWVKPTEDLITRSNERGSYKFSAQYVGSDKEDVSGLLCTLVFEVNADAADADVYAIRITESYGDIITEDETDLPFVLLDGAVVIGEEPEQTTEPDTTGADVPDNTTATPDDTTAAPDDSTAAPDDSTAAPDDSTAASDDTTTTTSYIGGGDIGGTTPDMGAVAVPVGALMLAAAAGVVLFKSKKR